MSQSLYRRVTCTMCGESVSLPQSPATCNDSLFVLPLWLRLCVRSRETHSPVPGCEYKMQYADVCPKCAQKVLDLLQL